MKKLFITLYALFSFHYSQAHVVTFCGEVVPIDKDFVSSKLMNTIKKNMSLVNMADLRARAYNYFPIFDAYLAKYGVPADFKYLAIVESNLKPVTSPVGAQGFWQIMPGTAKELQLNISGPSGDERNDLHRSTDAAARLLASYYKQLKKLVGVYSWILTAASYNCGPGCVQKRVRAEQQTDYFDLNLNPETANYVYRIIAIKELFEYPEIYMKNFGYNIFNKANANRTIDFGSVEEDVKKYDGFKLKVKKKKKAEVVDDAPTFEDKLFAAHIKGKYGNFKDGDLITLEIDEAFNADGRFKAKGSSVAGPGWIIDDKIYVDLGYGPDVVFCDAGGIKGIEQQQLSKNKPVLLKARYWKE
jgi:membrane-bound lytic murein transglycosylase D